MSTMEKDPSLLQGNETMPIEAPAPREDEGFLLPDWMVHDTCVVDVRPYREPERRQGFGTFFYDQYTISDGTAYHVMEGIPEKQRSAIPVDGTTAWYTQPEGHNALTDLGLMQLGFRTRRIGAEIFPELNGLNLLNPIVLFNAIKKGWNISLGYSAHNMLEILEASDEEHHYEIEPGVSLTTGESRDPMIEPGLNLLGELREKPRLIAHADNVDPCVPDGIQEWGLLRGIKTLVAETGAGVRTAAHVLTSPDKSEYKRTLDPSPEALIPAITHANALLLSKQAGIMARMRPKKSPMHLSLMRKSHANDHKVLEGIYSDHPLVHIAQRNGSHADIPRTRRGVHRRHGFIIDQLQTNGDNPFELDFERVYALPEKRRGQALLRLVS